MSVARVVRLWAFVDGQGQLVPIATKDGPGAVALTFTNEDAARDWLDERYHYGEDGARYAQTLTMVPLVGRL